MSLQAGAYVVSLQCLWSLGALCAFAVPLESVQTKQCTQEKNGQWVVGSGSTGHAVFAVLGVL